VETAGIWDIELVMMGIQSMETGATQIVKLSQGLNVQEEMKVDLTFA